MRQIWTNDQADRLKKGGIFVTGTDTGVGKTHVSCALLRQLNQAGHHAVGMKPVASGAVIHNGQPANEDVLALQAASAFKADPRHVNPYLFKPAIAPHLAAKQVEVEISIGTILSAYHELAGQADIVVVEGAGGWLVPINKAQTLADVARELALPVLLVVDIRLGCINHALLSARAIEQDGLPLLGWIANHARGPVAESAQIIDTLTARLPAPLLGQFEHNPAESPDTAGPSPRTDLLDRLEALLG